MDIYYKINTANPQTVIGHLNKCNVFFIQRLAEKMDITEYANKIVENSIRFEAWKDDELVEKYQVNHLELLMLMLMDRYGEMILLVPAMGMIGHLLETHQHALRGISLPIVKWLFQ